MVTTTPQRKRKRSITVVTPSPSKQRKLDKNDDDALRRRDVAFFICRFRHGSSARDPCSTKRDFPPEKDIMQNLKKMASGCDQSDKAADCSVLRDFIKAYGVERNFRGMTADNVMPLLPIVQHIQSLSAIGTLDATLDPDAVIQHVGALANLCKEAGFARNLSFASKALNMLGHSVPIYSSECKDYLGIKTVEYSQFLNHWMEQFKANREVYENEARRLMGNVNGQPGPTWFAMRGLDQTMCRIGAPKQKQLLCPACAMPGKV